MRVALASECRNHISPAMAAGSRPVNELRLICRAVLSSGHADLVLIRFRTGVSHSPLAAAWTGARSRCHGWPEATPEGGLGLDAGEDVVTLCGVRGKGEDRGVGAEVSVSLHDAWSRLICAGWLPQDRLFGWSGALVLGRA